MVMVTFIISVVVALLLPIVLAVLAVRKWRLSWIVVIAGALAFSLSQIPHLLLLNGLQTLLSNQLLSITTQPWFPLVSAVVVGLLAGLCEQFANWLAFKWAKDKADSWEGALTLGLGHGGMEAILLVGLSMLPTLIYMLSVQQKGIDSLGLAAADAEALKAQVVAFWATPWHLPLAIGVERILALVMQVVMAVMVWVSIRKKAWYWLVAAIAFHTLIDATAVLINQYVLDVWTAESIIFLLAAISVAILYWIKKKVVPDLPPAPVVVEKPQEPLEGKLVDSVKKITAPKKTTGKK